MKTLIKLLSLLTVWFAVGLVALPAHAAPNAADATRLEIQKALGFVPGFIKAVPDDALPGAWRELASLQMNPKTALPGKVKELIGLAVASQIPCRYCIYGHTEFAKLNGASSKELGEAVSMAAITRHWSTAFHGADLDEARFKREIRQLISNAVKASKGPQHAPKAIRVVDANSAYADIRQSLGFVPSFFKSLPEEAVAGAWLQLKMVEMNPKTALSGKYKSLIGLAVASQIPCKYCVSADTEFAKLEGASEREIKEAVGMAALVRNWSTLLNGLQVDERQFRKDVDRLVSSAKRSQAVSMKTGTAGR